jgi:uncharacterized protein YgiM (DUF1202 family)
MIDGLTLPFCAKGTATTSERLNVRTGPGPANDVIGVLEKSEELTIWAVDNEWAIVQSRNDIVGWANMAYLTPIGVLTP